MIKELRHLASTFKLFGVTAAVLIVVLGVLTWANVSQESAAYAEANAAQSAGVPTPNSAQATTRAENATTEPDPSTSSTPSVRDAATAAVNAANAGWQTVEGIRYYYQADGTRATGTLRIDKAQVTFDEEGRWVSSRLDVPYISQLPDMPSGCEVVTVTMMLNFAGVSVSKEEVAALLPYADDPNLGFTGDLYSDGYSYYSGIIWPPALLDLVRVSYGSAVDLTGQSLDEILAYIEQGKPVSIWFSDGTFDHCVLLTGLSETTAWINDPLEGKDIALNLADFLLKWEGNGNRALSY